jgi:hypothetical protein
MPLATIPGFIKKRTASQQFRRSPRQLTRDITIALEMRDDTVLPHLKIRNEDGSVIDGQTATPNIIKKLRNEGRNPMWYLRRDWLEKTYGLRTDSERPAGESREPDEEEPTTAEQVSTGESVNPPIVSLMQQSIRELKRDKEMLTEQLKIKDEQIRETTERWKESNYISQGLNQRLEAMEKRFDLNTRLISEPSDQSGAISKHPSPTEPGLDHVAKMAKQTSGSAAKRTNSKSKRGVGRRQSAPSPQAKKNHTPRWYEMPTLKKILSRGK